MCFREFRRIRRALDGPVKPTMCGNEAMVETISQVAFGKRTRRFSQLEAATGPTRKFPGTNFSIA